MTRAETSSLPDRHSHPNAAARCDWRNYERVPSEIYAQSFATIEREADLARFDSQIRPVVTRMIHACGEVGIAEHVRHSAGAVASAQRALVDRAPVLCDSTMVAAGIMRRHLPADNDVVTTLNDDRVRAIADDIGNTRSAAAVTLWAERIENAVVVIGNAPTALFHLLELLDEGWPKPACILAFPVGFVGAAESKAELARDPRGCEFITLAGRWGGSAIAAAASNSLILDIRANLLSLGQKGTSAK